MLLPRFLLPSLALAASSASALVMTATYSRNVTLTIHGTPTVSTQTGIVFTTTIAIPTTSPYAAPSGAVIANVVAGGDITTTYAIAPTINAFIAPSAKETLTVGQPYTVKWKPNDVDQTVNIMLFRGNNSLLKPVQLIGGFSDNHRAWNGSLDPSVETWGPVDNSGSVEFTPDSSIFSGDDYVIFTNGASGVNESPFFSIYNPHPPSTPSPAKEKKPLTTAQVAGIIGGIGGFIVLVTLLVFLFCLARRNGWFVGQFKTEVNNFKTDLNISYPKEYKADTVESGPSSLAGDHQGQQQQYQPQPQQYQQPQQYVPPQPQQPQQTYMHGAGYAQ